VTTRWVCRWWPSRAVCCSADPVCDRRFGFRTEEQLVYPGVPPEYFMLLPLPDAPLPQGTMAFHPAFGATE
jgi:putative acetyltransferase